MSSRIASAAGRHLGAGLLLAACLGVFTWLAVEAEDRPEHRGGSHAGHRHQHSRSERHAIRMVRHAHEQQISHFALLRTKAEGLPPTMTDILAQPAYGMNPALAQRMPTAAKASWVVPANGYLCIVGREPGSIVNVTCARNRRAVARGLASVSLYTASRSRRRLIVGVAPDRARAMRVRTGGSVAIVPVTEGTFVLRDRLTRPPSRLVPL